MQKSTQAVTATERTRVNFGKIPESMELPNLISVQKQSFTRFMDEGLREATWDEALELVSAKLKETWKADKTRLAFWLSGQQPITEGYACAKFWR